MSQCITGKVCFMNRAQAEDWILDMNPELSMHLPTFTYLCSKCESWHMTKKECHGSIKVQQRDPANADRAIEARSFHKREYFK